MSENRGTDGVTDEVFAALADERRRYALAHLRTADGATPIPELADRIAAAGNAESHANEDVTTALHHVHIPKLVDAGLVEWNGDGVTTTEVGEELPSELPWLPEDADGRR